MRCYWVEEFFSSVIAVNSGREWVDNLVGSEKEV